MTDHSEEDGSVRRRRKDDRPGEIVLAALKIFHAKGFSATKIENIAQEAGVAVGTVYRYFQNKQDLFKAAVRELVIPSLDRIEECARAQPTPREQLRTALRLWAEATQNNRGCITKLIIAEAGNFPDLVVFFREEVSGRVHRMLKRIVEDGIAKGDFRICDPAIVVRLLAAPIVMASIWRHTFPGIPEMQSDMTEQIDALLELVFEGIDVRQGTAR